MTADGFGTEFDEEDQLDQETEVDRFGQTLDEQEAGQVNIKVYVPPRRRTATLDVAMTSGKKLKLSINKTGVKLMAPSKAYYNSVDSVTIPRNVDDLCRLRDLIDAGIAELEEQNALAEDDK